MTAILSLEPATEKIAPALSQPGTQISAMQSPQLSGFYIPPRVEAILIANGWTPPPSAPETQDPTEGLFLCQKETP